MLFNSWKFILFFPFVLTIYFLVKPRFRYIWLLIASYFFYMCWNPRYIILIGISTVITFGSGILIERSHSREKSGKCWVVLSLLLNLGILFLFKYLNFTILNIEWLLNKLNAALTVPRFDVLLPVGISFYTFQALSYTMDVYRKEIKAERHFLRYALFVSFFPQLVAGPIERSGSLLAQINQEKHFDWDNFRDGLLYMIWGFFEKMVIADRIAILVDTVYSNYTEFVGFQIAFATILFGFQVYCDFAGYTDIAIGAAKIMGFHLMKNFRQPYFSMSIADFWRRWHISLSTWFRDYLYIPLGGNRKGQVIKYRNIMIVFMVSGLWHGASWGYIIWGGLHGVYQIIGDLLKPYYENFLKQKNIRTNCFSWRLLKKIITFILVDFAWLFFRAAGARTALRMILHSIRRCNPFPILTGGLYEMGLNRNSITVLTISLMILFIVDYLKEKGNIKQKFLSQNKWFYYGISYAGILVVLFFGIYGEAYNPSQFIYFQF